MSTFNGIIPEIKDISVDRFTGRNLSSKSYFLTHCHTDHTVGLKQLEPDHLKKRKIFIYTSKINYLILKSECPHLKPFIKTLEILQPSDIVISNDNSINVVLIPAGHCPGSVMFLFRRSDGFRVLYTGDFRFEPKHISGIECLHNSDGSAIFIDRIYLDTTFWNENYSDFPNREKSCETICNIIENWTSKGRDYVVNLITPARYGSEGLFGEIYKRIKQPIHVSENTYEVYRQIVDMDKWVTEDAKSTQIHCHYRMKSKRPNHREWCMRYNNNILLIKPSALRWKNFNLTSSDGFTVERDIHFVCYSSHCSFNELKEFIAYFKPDRVIPCVADDSNIYSSIDDYCQGLKHEPAPQIEQRISWSPKVKNVPKTESSPIVDLTKEDICIELSSDEENNTYLNKMVYGERARTENKPKRTKLFFDHV